jgi:hypothetical protein
VQQAGKAEMVNHKTANARSLTVARVLLARAEA